MCGCFFCHNHHRHCIRKRLLSRSTQDISLDSVTVIIGHPVGICHGHHIYDIQWDFVTVITRHLMGFCHGHHIGHPMKFCHRHSHHITFHRILSRSSQDIPRNFFTDITGNPVGFCPDHHITSHLEQNIPFNFVTVIT